ncbi:MAG: Piwi domain-containing protein [Nostoc sp. CmiVER01]|uniref:Piwi domain-containing protein n=1 Tax=Nostoc sp. CmiVER01 TaxID=3075384 RepID=UPI002AD398F4|nr:Piwi domain-containing protein [Nostoc sp. CmiVER01]MDZ8123244.1 Piwi domain-containing protein [Nostoc sp. CmiVER01]
MNKLEQTLHLAATLYPLVGLEKTRYRFRLLKVIEKVPQDNNKSIRIQRWADRLWREELRCPVYPTTRFDGTGFLIPYGNSPAVGNIFEITDVPDKVYHIEVTDKSFEVSIEEALGSERELICRMLERPFTDKFQALEYKFWRSDWTLFFRQFPENEGVEKDIVNAYRGLKFGVVLLQDVGIHLAADIRTKYVGKKSLQDYTDEEKEDILKQHIDLSIRADDRAYFLRDNIGVKIPCRYTGNTEKSINEYSFDLPEKTTVYKYYCSRYPNIPVHSNEAAILVQDRTKETSIAVPISRLFPIFTTEYEGIRKCSIRSQMTPDERVNTISTFLNELSEVEYEDIPVSIQQPYLKRERNIFIPPRLEFGKGEIHKPFPKGSVPPKTNHIFDKLIMSWASSKLSTLYRNGAYHNETIPNLILFYPKTLERDTRETFVRDLEREIEQQTGQRPQIIQQRHYDIGKYERRGSSLLRILAEIRSSNPKSLAIIVLWDRFLESVHGELKEVLRPVMSQCVTERVVRNIARKHNPQLATSQLQNLALAVSTEAGIQPWVIADPLHHDLHIGIDLLFGKIGYHFLYGTGGRLIQQYFGNSTLRGRMQEAIKKPELRNRLEETIRSIVKDHHQINSIIIHRDGRWWSSESSALQETVARLKKEDILPKDFRCAVVEIRKSHLPVRLFTVVEGNSREYLQNALFGTYLILDSQRIILTTTGRPGAWDDSSRGKTANNLLLEVVETIGEFNTQDIAEDTYYLTHLNWNAPNIEIGLPVTIRWTDQALRETFRPQVEEEDNEELQEIESDDFG